MSRPRRPVAAIVVAIACAFLTCAPGAAFAQDEGSSAPSAPSVPAGVSLVSQTPWVALRSDFSMKLHIDDTKSAALPGAAIAIRIHDTTRSRSSFDDVIANRDLGTLKAQPNTIPIASLRPDAHNDVTVTFGLSGSTVRPTIPISRPGVYPVEVSLVGGSTPSGSFVTWLVTVDAASSNPVDEKLSVSFVWQLVADPTTEVGGQAGAALAATMQPKGRLDRIASVFDHTDGFPVSIVVSPETVETWRSLAQRDSSVRAGLSKVRKASRRATVELMPAPYVPIDLVASTHAGFGGFLKSEYAHGAQVLRGVLGTGPADTNTAFVDPASDDVIDQLRGMLADRVAVRDGSLIPTTHPFTPAQTFVLDTTTGRSRAAATAPFVEKLFDGPDPAALKAERVVAALAEVAYETPAIPRGVVIAPPPRWTPDVALMTSVIDGLRDNPLVQPATLDQFFKHVSNEQVNGFDAERRLAPATPAQTPLSLGEYEAAVDQLAAYRDVVGPHDPVVVSGTHALLVALSTSITPEDARALFTRTGAAVAAFERGVSTDAKRVTLTARRAKVPLSFVNSLKPARDVQVRVHLDSPKMVFPNGADQVVTLKPGNNTIPFLVEARASGTFPMTISVTSPNGQLAFGAPVRVTVRSAVFGHLAIALTIAAVVFLALWWANHFRRNRRGRRLSATPAPAA